MTPSAARKIVLSFEGAYERPSYGTPAFFVGKKLFTQVGSRKSRDIMLLTQTLEERDHLVEADPATFYITEHFRNYKGLLARIDKLDARTFRALLERRWRAIAPKKMVKDLSAPVHGGGASRSEAEGVGSDSVPTRARPPRGLRPHSPRKRGEKRTT